MNILKTLNAIAQCSQPSSGVTRLPFTKEHKQANKIITQWMKDAGMQVHLDAAASRWTCIPASFIHWVMILFACLCSLVKGRRVTPDEG